MIKHLHCLLGVFVCLVICNIPKAAADDADFSGCCKAPIDLTYWCNDLPYDFSPYNIYQLQQLFGKPQNKCYTGAWVELEPIIHLSNCETGTITRRFQVSAHYGYEYCEQKITIKGTHNYDIRFPADLEVTCGQVPSKEDLVTNESGCDLLAISVVDQNFSLSGSGCGKIFRTYKVINWCEYDGISDRKIIGRDEDCDGAPGDEPVWVLRRSDGIAYIDRDDNPYNNNPQAYERVNCNPTNPKGYWRTEYSTGYWEYTQHIKITDKIAPIVSVDQPSPICSYNNTCDASVKIPFNVWDDCTPNDIKIKVFINGVKIAEYNKGGSYNATGTYKVGSHELEIHASDGCGNSTVIKTPFKVVDCKAPAPICINGITVSLMPAPPNTDVDGDGSIDQAAMTIWAKDLIASTVSDCSGIAGFSINRVGETPSIDKTNLVITCEDMGTLNVEIYAWDRANNPYAVQPDGTVGGRNFGRCRTYILVQANNNVCGAPAVILGALDGQIQTEDEHGLESVMVELLSTDTSMQLTTTEGKYEFDSLKMDHTYRIVPSLNSNYTQGITISDLIALHKHILGIELINSPYKRIAADVDGSGDITTSDLLELRQLLLGVTEHFENTVSWRFVDANYVFPDTANPWSVPFPETIEIDHMSADRTSANFIAIKMGDVDGSVMSDQESASARSQNNANVIIEDQTLQSGTWLEVPVQLAADIEAACFELHYDTHVMELMSIKPGMAQAAHVNTAQKSNGILRIVWNSDLQTYSTTPNNTLFTLQFRANRWAQLREVLRLSEHQILADAQQTNGEKAGLALQFTDAKQAPVFALYPNAPNPFREQTILSFQLPEATSGTIRIHDLTGKLLWEHQGDFAKGYNQLIINRASLPAQGLLLYTLETPQHRATRRMIVLPE